ncbi:MAG: phage major capsid protein, partial [Minwuiales bacterium]|nr:phage major capsid protein [Minwuiales bacterium]
ARQFFGMEILDHKRGAVDLDFFKSGRAPLLVDHDRRDHVGVIVAKTARVDSDKIGRATVRFGNSPRAQEIFDDVTNGIRVNVSVSYVIEKLRMEEESEDGPDTFRVTEWRPLEISIVSVPADTSVGVGRADGGESFEVEVDEPGEKPTVEPSKQERAMPDDPNDQNTQTTAAPATPAPVPAAPAAQRSEPAAPQINPEEIRRQEVERARHIRELASRHNMRDLGETAIGDGTTIEQFRGLVLANLPDATPLDTPATQIGLNETEARSFSFLRAMRALLEENRELAAFEFECSRTIAERLNKQPSKNAILVPLEAQIARAGHNGGPPLDGQRDLSVGTPTAGGHLVGTDHMASSFIDLLRNAMMVRAMGATVMTGLVGNVSIPKQTGGATAVWVAEAGNQAEQDQTFGQVTMSPKAIAAYTELSKTLLRQSSPDAELIVRTDLAIAAALAIDLAAINGTGVDPIPEGILNTAGIGDVPLGVNGDQPTWGSVINLWTEVAIDNAAFGSTGYLTNAAVIGKLAQTEKAAGTAQFIGMLPGADGMSSVAGQRAGVSNQVPSDLTKGTSVGVLSAMIYGNWRDLMIGEWGSLEIQVNPYSKDTQGQVRITVYHEVDVAVRRAESFAAIQDMVTT